jgi:NAD+ kinase
MLLLWEVSTMRWSCSNHYSTKATVTVTTTGNQYSCHEKFLLLLWMLIVVVVWPVASFTPTKITLSHHCSCCQQQQQQQHQPKIGVLPHKLFCSASNDMSSSDSTIDNNNKTNTNTNTNQRNDDIVLPSTTKVPFSITDTMINIQRIPSLLNRTTSGASYNNKLLPLPIERNPAVSSSSSSTTASKIVRKMNLRWCQSDRCVDVARERVIGEHNQIMLTGPATGQVAFCWDQQLQPQQQQLPDKTTASTTTSDLLVSSQTTSSYPPPSTTTTTTPTTISSVLILVRKGDEALLQIAAENVPKLTEMGIHVLLAPDISAKLKHYYGVDDPRISLFVEPKDPNVEKKWKVRYMDDDEDEWLEDMNYVEPFPDLVVTLGGDGLMMHASMMFQGPVPPLLAISGGSLGFLTPFCEPEMVDAVKTALGVNTNNNHHNNDQHSSSSSSSSFTRSEELQVFPPNMPSYPYEPLWKAPHSTTDGPSSSNTFKFFGRNDVICLTIRMRLDCRIVNRDGVVRVRYNVLNEVVVDRGSSPYLAALECFCDDVHLTTVQADGVIFATPTGSTAYSMSAGGSVVHPAVPCIMVTPICPHVLSFRSMVFPDHVVLRCYVPDDARSTAAVAFDGKHRRELQRGDSVQIQMSAYPVPTINRGDHSSDWLESLKRSFNFNTRPRQRPL